MAYLEMHYYSAALQRQVTVNVLLPESSKSSDSVGKPEGSCKTLYLYHGLSGDQTAWMRRTSIERYADKYKIAFIMPNVDRSWYTDMATAREIQRIRNERREARRIPTEKVLGTAFTSIALRWVRKQPRMKTTKLEDITKVARYTSRDGSTGFKIEAKGKTFTLHS